MYLQKIFAILRSEATLISQPLYFLRLCIKTSIVFCSMLQLIYISTWAYKIWNKPTNNWTTDKSYFTVCFSVWIFPEHNPCLILLLLHPSVVSSRNSVAGIQDFPKNGNNLWFCQAQPQLNSTQFNSNWGWDGLYFHLIQPPTHPPGIV